MLHINPPCLSSKIKYLHVSSIKILKSKPRPNKIGIFFLSLLLKIKNVHNK